MTWVSNLEELNVRISTAMANMRAPSAHGLHIQISPIDLKRRLEVLGTFLALYLGSVVLGLVRPFGYLNATGVRDLGQSWIPSLATMVGMERAEYVLWLGTLPLELFFGAIVISVLFTGKGVRLGLCIYGMYFLHWICLHATTLPPPDHIVWNFPPGIFTFGNPSASDFWFSGHVGNALLIALAANRSPRWLSRIAWSFFAFQILLVLSARTHYSIDVVGGIFVAYTFHRVSLDLARAWSRRSTAPALDERAAA